MTSIFRGGATNNLADEFHEKMKYKKFLLESGYYFLDTLYKEALYGFINRSYEVIAPVPDTTTFGDYSAGTEGLVFVVNQFNDFRAYYLEKAAQGNFTVPALITDLQPRVSFEDFELNYSRYLDGYKASMVQKVLDAGSTLNFAEFIGFCQRAAFNLDIISQPATKSGFMLSNSADVYNTGLYIDLRQSPERAVDQDRADFILDEGFPCFMELANKFGFYIDGNFPWRIAVNLKHKYTISKLMNGRPTPQFANFYSDQYTMKVMLDDYDSIIKMYKEMYIAYNELRGISTLESFSDTVSPELFLETLLLHKFIELSLMRNYEDGTYFKLILKNVIDRYNRFGLLSNSGAIGYINAFCAEELKNKILGQP